MACEVVVFRHHDLIRAHIFTTAICTGERFESLHGCGLLAHGGLNATKHALHHESILRAVRIREQRRLVMMLVPTDRRSRIYGAVVVLQWQIIALIAIVDLRLD